MTCTTYRADSRLLVEHRFRFKARPLLNVMTDTAFGYHRLPMYSLGTVQIRVSGAILGTCAILHVKSIPCHGLRTPSLLHDSPRKNTHAMAPATSAVFARPFCLPACLPACRIDII